MCKEEGVRKITGWVEKITFRVPLQHARLTIALNRNLPRVSGTGKVSETVKIEPRTSGEYRD